SPLFWLGIAAVGAPILVHLVRRTRARKVEFPALTFVRQVPQRTIRRRTLRNLLLLILRCLAILLIVLAFTRPFFTRRSAAKDTGSAGATVILIDSSLSMRREQMFAQALQRAAATIDEARTDERLALLTFGSRYEVISRFTADKSRLRTLLRALTAGWEGTDYEQALRGAESLFGELKAGGPRRIVLISDFQASGWSAANASFKLGSETQLQTFDVGGNNPAPNVAVTKVDAHGLVFGQKYSENVAVQISNYSDAARDRLAVAFQINDQTVDKREVSLNARDVKLIEFTGFNLAEGANRCAVEIAANDFAADNKFYFTIRRENPAKALIIESASRGRSDSFYLQSALTLNDELPFSFTVKSAGGVDPGSVAENALVILNDAGPVSGSLAASLRKFVEAGGQLIIAAGPHTDANSFNEGLGPIAPATLRDAVQNKTGESVAITDIKFDHPIFEVFRESGRLAAARVFGYFRSEPRPNATVLARFEDGSAALVEANAGKGRVLLFASSLGPGWNELALTPLYLPFVHQMARYMGTREENPWYGLGQTFTVAKEPKSGPPAVDSPDGTRWSENRLTADGDLLVTGRQPGFYRLRYSAAPNFAAVDLDAAEGDFTKLDFAAFMNGVTGGSGNVESREANRNSSNEEIENRQRVWWPILFLALLILITESLLAQRIKVAKIVG
ncbi:MAG TPA: VWA domain-containing protein, partial [Pyrinomonadaceae bacterium]|nr:VWA domain-containing protein [Pyrinomonadaceae bacterium]